MVGGNESGECGSTKNQTMRKLLEYISTVPVFHFATTPAPLRTTEPEIPSGSAVPAPARGYIECGFCHCKLTRSSEGDNVYSISEQAREFRDEKEKHRKAIEKTDEELVKLRAEISAKDAEIATLKNSAGANKPGSHFL